MNDNHWNRTWRAMVERSWSDPAYRRKLIDDPDATLAEAGIEVPPGVHFVVVENEVDRLHLVLPAHPDQTADATTGEDSALSNYHAAVVF
jgi:hypothetical protein